VHAGEMVLPGGRLIVQDGAPEGDVTAMLRPESISLTAPEAGTLRGRVETVSFGGDRVRVTVAEAAETVLTIDTSNAVKVVPGEVVGLKIDPAAVRLLPGEGS
jgi:putative spermidine/putrescine transport system ATP-binding protein